MPPFINDPRTCPHCQKKFTPNSGKHCYCKPSCKVAAFKAEKKQEAAHLSQVLAQKAEELEALEKAPRSRRKVVQELNPAWRLASQQVEAQEQVCQTAITERDAWAKKKAQLTSTRRGAALGVGAGLMLGLMPVAHAYEARKGRPLSLTFLVVAMAGLLLACLVGHYLGTYAQQYCITTDPDLMSQSAGLDEQWAQAAKRLRAKRKALVALKQARTRLPKFTKETVVYAEETVAQVV